MIEPIRNERGIALAAVIIVGMVMMAIVGVSSAVALKSQNGARYDQDWNAALSAAEAGIDDYIYRINRDGNYWNYSAANPPPGGNSAFTQFVPVPGPANEGTFRYTPVPNVTVDGTVKIISTGRVRNAQRTVTATIRRRNFLDYLYFTEYETKDPAAYALPDVYSPAQAQSNCSRHYYDNPPRAAGCTIINFVTGDIIRGPLHTNDAFTVIGTPRFEGNTTTSWRGDATGKRYLGTGSPYFARTGDPAYATAIAMPPTNSAIRAEADSVLGGTGCLYTGPTRIVLNATGTMNVTSPRTKSSNCALGNNVPLPVNGVIYVQGVPASRAPAAQDPNYNAPSGNPANTCGNGTGNRIGYPVSGDLTAGYGCTDGDVFLEGTLKGRLTIAAADTIVITGNTTYLGGTTGTDVLGLIADNYIQVYHPVRCATMGSNGTCQAYAELLSPNTGPSNVTIQAALLSLSHSFIVQNYQRGTTKGTLTVTGAIAQRYRGPVGTTGNTGFIKNYTYDQRLKYTSPPFFLDPVKSAWGVATWGETVPSPAPTA